MLKKKTSEKTRELVDLNRKEHIRKRIVRLLACLVVFCTLYSLILPGMTLQTDEIVFDCTFSVHEHSDVCYNEANELICGKADFAIHTHNENCYDPDGNLRCMLEEHEVHIHNELCYEDKKILVCENIDENHVHEEACYEASKLLVCENKDENHVHSDECYEIDKELICKEQTTLHSHIDSCYDENKALICGMLELEEHVHSDSCYAIVNTFVEETPIDTTEATPSNTTEANSSTTGNKPCGKNDDGSIWWGTPGLGIVDTIEEGKGYIIAGYQGNTLMTNEEIDITPEGGTNSHGIKAVSTQEDINYELYEYWYFERVPDTNNYYMYCKNSDNQTKYLQLSNQSGDSGAATLHLIDEKAQASIFSIVKGSSVAGSEFPNLYLIYTEIDGSRLYIDSYCGDDKYLTTHYGVWSEVGYGTHLKISRNDVPTDIQTANPIKTEESVNSVINLFDYWTTPNRSDRDDYEADLNGGINQGHALKFSLADKCPEAMNVWTGSQNNPLQGIVANKLGEDHYPHLSGDVEKTGSSATDSLAYLFNPKLDNAGKKTFTNVTGLLEIDEQGYYSFDADKNMAEFDEKTTDFTIYDHIGVPATTGGSFFPFNNAPEIMTANPRNYRINHYFGMSLNTRFVQRYGGHTNEKRKKATTFNFSGDDDVWIFIDNVLVGDAGGIHDASDLNIDFSTGKVTVHVAGTNENILETTLSDCFKAAGEFNINEWDEVSTTTDGSSETGTTEAEKQYIFKDNTLHSLKFYFLERGNNESNLKLKYNLTEIPHTAIYKVDQYGAPIQGVDFTVYAANDKFQMLNDKGGSVVTGPIFGSNVRYDATNNILDNDGNIIAHALYNGTTDSKGAMIFVDDYQMPLTLNEIEDICGQYFILRETKMPDNLRWVSEDNHLRIWQSAQQKFLKCENIAESGTRASITLQVTATDQLHLRRTYHGSKLSSDKLSNDKHVVQYCDDEGNPTGTLFAVVYKYLGPAPSDEEPNPVNNTLYWHPVWGIDKDGYTVERIQYQDGASDEENTIAGLDAAIKAAKKSKEHYGEDDIVFTSSKSSTMRLIMDNLPGNITKYYSMLNADSKNQAEYTVSYYWTDADNLDQATTDNTYRVYTFGEPTADGVNYSAFDRVFGANIYVPNLTNQLLVQKQSDLGKLVDGATFGLYQVEQDDAGVLWATSTTGEKVKFPKEAIPNENTGEVKNGDGKFIAPIKTEVTKTYAHEGQVDPAHAGTARFVDINAGEYIVKEIKSPKGYKINQSDIMVLVTNDIIYANAGTDEDNVSVGRGPGFLVNPLLIYGAVGEVDDTLSWIYSRMLISNPSTDFADATSSDTSVGWGYLTKNFTGEKGEKEDALRSYLVYSKDSEEKFDGLEAFNYVKNTERTVENGAVNPSGTRRLFTTVGWNHYAILQDYDYGLQQAAKYEAEYQDWSRNADGSDRNLMNLFSRSTYVIVADEKMEHRLILKNIDANDGRGVANAKFRFYKVENNVKQYYVGYNSTDNTAIWSASEADAQITVSGDDGVAPQYFDGLEDGTYYFEEVQKPGSYLPITKPIKLEYEKNIMTLDSQGQPGPYHITEGYIDNDTGLFTFRATIPHDIYYHLPETGGSGDLLYIILGLLLINGVAIVLFKKKMI